MREPAEGDRESLVTAHPLTHFDKNRPELARTVVERAMTRFEAPHGPGFREILLETIASEMGRLESLDGHRHERARLKDWHDLGVRLNRLDAAQIRHQVVDLSLQYVEDIAGRFDPRIYRLATRTLPWLINRILSPQSVPRAVRSTIVEEAALSTRFTVEGPLEKLVGLSERGPMLFVPTHSSNLDSGVLGWSLHMAGLPPVTYGAGKNLFTNPYVGFLLRHLGAYRVDRRIKHSMYKEILKEYSTTLIRKGYHSLFFPGGTRIRSGAIESRLKLGLLGTAVEAYGAGVEGITVVPVTLNYAITLEAETLIADELADAEDRREIIEDDESSRIRPLLGFMRQILSMDGSLVIRYGEPMDPLGNRLDDQGHPVDPRGRRVDAGGYFDTFDPRIFAERCREATRMLGESLVASYRRNSIFLPTHLLARVVYDRVFGPAGSSSSGGRPPPGLRRSMGHTVELVQIRNDLTRWLSLLETRGSWGEVGGTHLGSNVEEVMAQALRSFRAFHSVPAIERKAGQIVVRHPGLMYYYRNRLAHLRGPDAGSEEGFRG